VGLFCWAQKGIRGKVKPKLHSLGWCAVALTAITGLSLAASGELHAQASQPVATPTSQFRDVVDEAGRAVRIPQPVQRIVSLAPSLTEMVYALGMQDHLVGDTNYCDYPPDAQKKQKVGDTLNPSLEEIVALHPDLVLATKNLNRLDTVVALEGLHIAAYSTNTNSIEQILSSMAHLADVLGVRNAGDALVTELRLRLESLQQRLGKVQPSRVLFVVWDEPLISVGKNTFIADALRYAGAASIVDSRQNWPQVSLEEVVRLQPDFLIFTQNHASGGTVDVKALARRPGWRGLDAVQNHRYAVISEAVNRPAPRIVSAIEDLARQLHPEAFETKSPTPPAAQDPKDAAEACACAL
jgi:iron complex transport system substrate-binding protein